MIVISDLWKSFKPDRQRKKELDVDGKNTPVHAVAGVNFTCQPGRVFSLLGPNGAGKTTTLRMIATLLAPTSGSIHVSGIDAVRHPQDVRKKIGFLTGSTRLYDRLTPHEIVKYYADLHKVDGKQFKERRDELFSFLEIEGFADRRIGKLSTGMRQKVSIARTMIHDPEVIIFDEPTVGLDVITARHIIDLIKSCRKGGKTVLFSTHIMGEVSLLSDDLAIMHNGKLCFNGTYADFRSSMKEATLEEEFIRLVRESER
ncbi:MAG: ATP-binding cassette domain-containing protein [Bacteroidota bacterium]